MHIHDPKTDKTYIRKKRRVSDEPGKAYELTFSCYHRFRFLEKDRARNWFVDAVQEARSKLRFDLWAWVLMPEHVHLLVYPGPNGSDVGQIRGKIKELTARPAIAYLEDHAPKWLEKITVNEGTRTRRRFWQPGGGYDRNVIAVETAQKMIDYIHANPVRRGLVSKSTDWKWSSAQWYANQSEVPISIDKTLPPQNIVGPEK